MSLAAMFGSTIVVAEAAPDHCYDFSNMADTASYTVGDVIDTKFATITIKPYKVDGVPAEAANRGANSIGMQMAGGTSPELELKLVALNIVPKKPVKKISTQIAQNVGIDEAYANAGLGVNKKGLKSKRGFAGMDGKVVGTTAKGKAKISANIAPLGGGGYWHAGTLEFNAVEGSIESIRLGGHTWRIDNMCFTL